MSVLKKLPLPVTGLSLALAALGNLLQPYGDPLKILCGILSGAVLVLFALKLVFCRAKAAEEFKNPVPLSVLPTSTMTLMLLCTYIKPAVGMLANVLWYCAVSVHVCIMIVFIARCVSKAPGFSLDNAMPSWFIAAVGIAVAGVTCVPMEARLIGQIAFYIGFALFFAVMALIIYRGVKKGGLPEPVQPTAAIITAPMSLCIAAYMNAFETPDITLLIVMAVIAAACYAYVTIRMFKLLQLRFYPTCVAFTFPYVISAVAAKAANAALSGAGYTFLAYAPIITLVIAIIMVAYVLVRYTVFMVKQG